MRDMTIRRNYQVYLPRLKEGTGVSRKDTENLLLVVVLWFSPFFLCVLLVFYSRFEHCSLLARHFCKLVLVRK